MIDVSMAGAVATLTIAGKSVKLSEWSDDQNPIQITELEIRKGDMNLNGLLVSWASPNPISVQFALIPGSDSDNALKSALRAGHVGGKGENIGDVFVSSLEIVAPYASGQNVATNAHKKKKWMFNNGFLASGSPAQGSNSDGKADTNTYSFIFESAS